MAVRVFSSSNASPCDDFLEVIRMIQYLVTESGTDYVSLSLSLSLSLSNSNSNSNSNVLICMTSTLVLQKHLK